MDVIRLFAEHKRLLLVVVLILILIFIITLPLYATRYHLRILTAVLMFVILAVSWAMFSGTTGYMSLAPAAFLGTGIYTLAIGQDYLPFPVLIIIGGLISFAFALLVGLVTLRLKGIYFAIFTFGLVVLTQKIVHYIETEVFGTHGRYPIAIDYQILLYTMLGLVVATVVAIYFIRRSRLGLAMLSIGGNEEGAEHMGVNTTRVKVLTFAISAIFMGAAGVVMASLMGYVNPAMAFSTTYSFLPILMAVFGGVGPLYGPIIGAVGFGYLERTLRSDFPTYFELSFGIIMVVVILFLPNGIAGLAPALQARLGRVISKLQKGGQAEQHANT
jgi:branched-chain amino acid transport system permease protein